jgi:NitT/TauT family transport system substrate-binding protein
MMRRLLVAALMVSLSAACATTDATRGATPARSVPSEGPAEVVRLGLFPNVTHATALYGVAEGVFAEQLGATELEPQVFNAGPIAVEALFAGALDAAYLGPNPTINAFLKSQGEAVRIVAGAASGGASFVVQPEITDVRDLAGKQVASPQVGGTQDIALRHYLAENGFEVDERGAGTVTVVAQDNGQTLQLFRTGEIAGAWLPEPWASRLVLEAGGRVLLDERELWPDGRFATTHLVVRTEFLQRHPETVRDLVEASVEANRQIAANPERAKRVVNDRLEELAGERLSPAVLDRAFGNLELTDDPIASTLRVSAQHAFATGLVEEGDLTGIYDLRILREVLGADVDDAGLGVRDRSDSG